MLGVRGEGRKGATLVLVMLSLVILLGSAALTVDVGRIFIAAERAQSVADAAALSAIPVLGDAPAVERAALAMVRVNNDCPGGFDVLCRGFTSPSADDDPTYSTTSTLPAGLGNAIYRAMATLPHETDIILYGPGSTLPDGTVLGPLTSGLIVTCHIYVPHTFARIYGAEGALVSRQATVLKGAMGGGVVTPMWIAASTPVVEGQTQNILMGHTDIPGNFGWLDIPPEADMRWYDIISGVPLTPITRQAMTVGLGDIVDGLTGLGVGRWERALQLRIARAAQPPWTGQDWYNCTADNPRIMLVPMVTYLGLTGTNALYRIERFCAFWLEGTTTGGEAGSVKVITGRFIRYETAGMVAPDLGPPSATAYSLAG